MAINVVDTATLVGLKAGADIYNANFSDSTNAASKLVGTGATEVPTNADVRNLRNLIINPSFTIWQEGNTVLVPSNTLTYTADQYFCLSAGASLNATKSVDDSSQTCLALTGVGSSTLVSFGQRIEGANAPRNTTEVTLSFRVLMPTLDELTWDLSSPNTLDDFSAQTSIGTGTFGTLAAGWHDLEVTIPATSAQLATGYQIAIVLPNGLATTNILKYSEVAIYKGNVPREFQSNKYREDLAECQWYWRSISFYRSGILFHSTAGLSTTSFSEMRIPPALTGFQAIGLINATNAVVPTIRNDSLDHYPTGGTSANPTRYRITANLDARL